MADGGCLFTLSPSGLPVGESQDAEFAALQRYLRGPVKSDRLDALTLAKMPFIDPEKLVAIYLPPDEIHALQRLTRQWKRIESDVSGRKIRISAIVDGYLPGVRHAFNYVWSSLSGQCFPEVQD